MAVKKAHKDTPPQASGELVTRRIRPIDPFRCLSNSLNPLDFLAMMI